jgi:hypothetical protein
MPHQGLRDLLRSSIRWRRNPHFRAISNPTPSPKSIIEAINKPEANISDVADNVTSGVANTTDDATCKISNETTETITTTVSTCRAN